MKKSKSSPINNIWFAMIMISIIVASYTDRIDALNTALFSSAKGAVTLALGLIGPMALWLGIMKVAEAGGLTLVIARKLKPVMTRLFPDVPPEHPAMAAIIMNMSANMLGLGNAATPMGIKAMHELEKLSPKKGVATDSMALFLAINTSSVTLLPLGVITIRASAGVTNPAAILIPSLLATICSTTVAIIASKLMAKANPLEITADELEQQRQEQLSAEEENELLPPRRPILGILAIAGFLSALLYALFNAIPFELFSSAEQLSDLFITLPAGREVISAATAWLIPIILVIFLSFGYFRGVPLYETVTDGAKEGFNTAVRIIPFMVAIFVAIGLIRESGTLDILQKLLQKPLGYIGMPVEALSMALIRPLSGSGAFAIMSEIVNNSP
jgi:spore maturation protein SpmA